MKIKGSIHKLKSDKDFRLNIFVAFSLLINLGYSLYNLYLGIAGASLWFYVMSVYYLLLGLMKLYSLLKKKKYPNDKTKQYGAMRLIGIFFFPLVMILIASIALTMKYGLYKSHKTIIMITIAAYTFYKIIMAIINFKKAKKSQDPTMYTIRNINIAEALVSMLTLQMSMFETFGNSEEIGEIHTLNIVSGGLVSLIIVVLGIIMIVVSSKKNRPE